MGLKHISQINLLSVRERIPGSDSTLRSDEPPACAACKDHRWVYKRDPSQPSGVLSVPCPMCGRQKIAARLQERYYPLPESWAQVTLENLRVVKGEEAALARAKQVAAAAKGWFSVQGTYGTGKTLMLAGILNAVKSRGFSGLYLPAQTFSNLAFEVLDPEVETTMRSLESALRHVHLLCVDELDKAGLEQEGYAFRVFYNIIDWRYNNRAMTALAFNAAGRIPPAIWSRMNDGLWGGIVLDEAKDQRPFNKPMPGVLP